MKKFLAVLALIGALGALSGCEGKNTSDTPRSATAYAASHGGPLTVRVTVSGGRIEEVTLVEFNDAPAVGGAAAEIIIERVTQSGAAKVDAVSGATVTSMALIQAIDEAARAAGATAEARALSSPPTGDLECDVLVIGGGGAGLYAALTAARQGADVVLCERLSILGGSAAISGGSIAIPRDESDILSGMETEQTVQELRDIGATLLLYPEQYIYTSVDPETGLTGGGGLITPLVEAAKGAGVRIYTDSAATNLTTDSTGSVTGALFRNASGSFTVAAKSVIICTGGNGAQQFIQEVGAVMVMTSAGNDGSGIDMAAEIGASAVQPRPLIASLNCQSPAAGILVTKSGKRFCSETANEFEIAAALMAAGETECYFISDRHLSAGISAKSAAELAEKLGISELESEINRYNGFCRQRLDEDFGKPWEFLEAISASELYAEKRAIVVYGTVGGLLVNENCAVLGQRGAIPNLYAAGEAANAAFFEDGYGGHGYSLAQVFYSARKAGLMAFGK